MSYRLAAAAIAPLPSGPVESAKREAARRAIDELIPAAAAAAAAAGASAPVRVGVGSGSTIVYAIQRLAERVQDPAERLQVVCVPTSFQSRNLLVDSGVPLAELNACPELDVALDGADEFEPRSLSCVKGGGACQTQEKLVASAARVFVLVADSRKLAPAGLLTTWRKGVPLEALALGYVTVMQRLREMGGEPTLRMAGASKAGPCVTDNGNLVIDVDFGAGSGLSAAGLGGPEEVHRRLKLIPGVVETGLFPHLATRAYVGNEDGTVSVYVRAVDVSKND
jgi:ribose 5-phosphate isomerase A